MSTNPGSWQHSEEYSRAAESFLPVENTDAPQGLDREDVRGQASAAKRVAWPGFVPAGPRPKAAGPYDSFASVPASVPAFVPASVAAPSTVSAPSTNAEPLAARLLRLLVAAWWRAWAKIERRRAEHGRRSLRVVETVALGEKRFVAIVQVQESRFLIGGGSAGVSLLARLDAEQPFAAVLEEQADPSASVAATRIREAW